MSVIQYVTKIHFAAGALETALPAELGALAARRALIVTDRGVVGAGLLDRLRAVWPEAIAQAVFDETPENPTEAAVTAAAAAYRRAGAEAIVALGGGSPMDLAKGAGLRIAHTAPLGDLAAVNGGVAKIGPTPPLIAIPTTAGTGSEVGRGAILTLQGGRKLGFLSPHLTPRAAICDPTLTLGLPPWLTAATGMDAVTHAVETYISTADNPAADGIALEGLRRAGRSLARAAADGADLAARTDMTAAAFLGALAFQKGLGAVHAISHALGGLGGSKLHHGALNAVLLPHVLRFNAAVVGARYGDIAAALGLARDADLPGEIAALTRRLGLPGRLSEMGVDAAMCDAAAPLAKADHTDATNPRAATAEDYRALMRDAF